jgi:predicted transcriptional regulator
MMELRGDIPGLLRHGCVVKWEEALALVAAGRTPKALAEVVGVTPAAVRSWLRGESVPCGWRWRALVIEAGMEGRWAELSAARDAVHRQSPGRPPLSEAEYAARQVRRRKRKQSKEVENGR